MKETIIVALTVLTLISGPALAMAGMNHQPHSVKTFMGKERKETLKEHSLSEKQGKKKGQGHTFGFQKQGKALR